MSNKLVLQIDVDDKGNPVLKNLIANTNKLDKKTSKLGKTLKNVFVSATLLQALYKMKNAFASLNQEILEYDKLLIQTRAINKSTTEDMLAMSKVMISLSNNTEHSSTAIAKANLSLVKMGFTAKEQLEILPHIVDLATASMVDMEQAMTTVGGVMKGFGLKASQVGHITDIMQETVNKSPMVFEDLMESMKFVAPIAKTMNISLLETSAMMSKLADAGIKGSLAGTTLKNTFLNILKPTDQIKKVLKENNYHFKSFAHLLGKLKDAGIPLTEILGTFNKRAIAGVSHLIDEAEATKKMTDELSKLDGVVKSTADNMRNSLSAQFNNLKNNFENIALTMHDVLKEGGSLDFGIQSLANTFSNIQEYIRDNPEQFQKMAEELAHVSRVISALIGGTLKVFIENLGIIASTTNIIIGYKFAKYLIATGKAFKFESFWVKKSAVSTIAFADATKIAGITTATTGKSVMILSTAMKSLNVYLLAAVTAYEAINFAFNKYNENLDKSVKNTSDIKDEDVINNRIEALKKLQKAFIKYGDDRYKAVNGYRRMIRKKAKDEADVFELEIKKGKVQSRLAKEFHLQKAYLKNLKSERDVQKAINGELLNWHKLQKDGGEKVKKSGVTLPTSTKNGLGAGGGQTTHPAMELQKISYQSPIAPKLPTATPSLMNTNLPTIPKVEKFNPFKEKDFQKDVKEYESAVKKAFDGMTQSIEVFEKTVQENNKIFETNIKKQTAEVEMAKSAKLNADKAVAKSIQDLNRIKEGGVTPAEKEDFDFAKQQEKKAKDLQKFATKRLKSHQNTLKQMITQEQSYNEQASSVYEADLRTYAELQAQVVDEQQQATVEKIDSIKEYMQEQGQAILDSIYLTVDIMNTIYDAQYDKMKARHKKEMDLITTKKKHAIDSAKDNIFKQKVLNAMWSNEQTKMREKQIKEEKEMRKKQKAMDIVSATINTAVAISKTFANVGMPAAIVLGALQLAMGVATVATIASQNYARGGPVIGNGGATSDSVPANLSHGEYVLSTDNVNSMGGVQGVEQLIDEKTSGSVNRVPVMINVDTLIGTEEYERGLFERLTLESERW